MRARASVLVFPAAKNSLLSRINEIVCLASSTDDLIDPADHFFLLGISRGARRALLAILNFHGVATGRSVDRLGGSGEPLKCKRKGARARRFVISIF